jgi:hypothetical protein
MLMNGLSESIGETVDHGMSDSRYHKVPLPFSEWLRRTARPSPTAIRVQVSTVERSGVCA